MSIGLRLWQGFRRFRAHLLDEPVVGILLYRFCDDVPWLTLAIDVASRMVAGFYLSLEHPSLTSVALAIRHMVLPKTLWLAEQNVIGDWPVYGLPTTIHLDNAREFRGRALAWGVAEHSINLIHRPVARPHYGGHIERLSGTMMGAIHFLPGSTSSDVASRGKYDPQKHAVMTFDELERWLTLEIVGRYHADIHRALRIPPHLAWEDAVLSRHERANSANACRNFCFHSSSISPSVIALMGTQYPSASRERVIAFVEEGHGHREAAWHFRVSPRFVNDLVILKRETGSLTSCPQGHPGGLRAWCCPTA